MTKRPTHCQQCRTAKLKQPKRGGVRKRCEVCAEERAVMIERNLSARWYVENRQDNAAWRAENKKRAKAWRARNKERIREYDLQRKAA